jgi:hypothetical protein
VFTVLEPGKSQYRMERIESILAKEMREADDTDEKEVVESEGELQFGD